MKVSIPQAGALPFRPTGIAVLDHEELTVSIPQAGALPFRLRLTEVHLDTFGSFKRHDAEHQKGA